MANVSSAFDFYAGQFYFIYNKIHVMMFLQLAKTTPYLSGQWKMDICLSRSGEDAIADSACLTPLSPSIPWSNDDALSLENYTIGESVRHLYNLTKDTFYQDIPNYSGKLKIYDKDSSMNTYEPDNIMGIRRAQMSRYGKQFAFLCPIWCEDASKIADLRFVATVSEKNGNVASQRESTVRSIHLSDTIKSRLEEWFAGVGDELLRIDFDKMDGSVIGVDPASGNVVTKDCSYITGNLISRERPLMESDSMICHAFSDNRLIARQLINLCFYFNLEDLMDRRFIDEFVGTCMNVSIEVFDGEEKLPLKDFFSNYDFIAKWRTNGINGSWDDKSNVLDYLKDTYCIDTILTNKTTQPIVHWSLTENNDYIFNTYRGFNAIVGDDRMTGGFYSIQANPFSNVFSAGSNNLNWLNVIDARGYSDASITEVIQNSIKDLATPILFENGQTSIWLNCNKYNTENFADSDGKLNKMYACIFVVSDAEHLNSILDDSYEPILKNGKVVAFTVPKEIEQVIYNILVFVCDDTDSMNALTLYSALKGNLKKVINASQPSNNMTSENAFALLDMIACYDAPIRIDFKKSVCCAPAASPQPYSQEIYYTKGDFNCNSTVYRYSGKIRPAFIDAKDFNTDLQNWHNDAWHYDTFDDSTDVERYNSLLNTGFLPEYMSIDFFALAETKPVPVEYSKAPNDKFCDFTWYATGWTMNLPERYECSIIATEDNKLDVEDAWKALADYINVSYDDFKKQIMPLYDISHDFDYLSNDNIYNIKHNFVFTLK